MSFFRWFTSAVGLSLLLRNCAIIVLTWSTFCFSLKFLCILILNNMWVYYRIYHLHHPFGFFRFFSQTLYYIVSGITKSLKLTSFFKKNLKKNGITQNSSKRRSNSRSDGSESDVFTFFEEMFPKIEVRFVPKVLLLLIFHDYIFFLTHDESVQQFLDMDKLSISGQPQLSSFIKFIK